MKKILCLLMVFFLSCEVIETKIEKGDIVTNCIIDSTWMKQQISTLDYEPTYFYRTNCDITLTTKKYQQYQLGDTIKFVKKRKKSIKVD